MDENKVYQDIRVFRFRAPLLKRGDSLKTVEFRADGPVPIFNDSMKMIGFATIVDNKTFGMANCAIDPANPERLDLEIGLVYWLDAILEFRGYLGGLKRGYVPTVAHVKGLVLTHSPVPDQEPIDPRLGALL